MRKIQKFLLKLDSGTRARLEDVIARILAGHTQELDVKKLSGKDGVYRVRVGRVRIQYIKSDSGNVVTNVTLRDDNTY